jgi:hypothetical protein
MDRWIEKYSVDKQVMGREYSMLGLHMEHYAVQTTSFVSGDCNILHPSDALFLVVCKSSMSTGVIWSKKDS